MNLNRRTLLTAVASAAAASSAWSREAPPLRIITSDQAGGGMDALIRTMAEPLAQALERPVLVDNRPGALGRIAAQAVVSSKPDGNTVLITVQAGIVINPHVYRYPYNPLKDLAPITDLGQGSLLLITAPHVPAQNFGELIRWIQTQPPNKVSYATYSPGTISHFGGMLLDRALGTSMLAVHYKASGDAIRDLIGGRVDFTFAGAAGPVAQLIKAGRLRAHAYMGKKRLAAFPHIPTLRELSYADVEAEGWIGIFAPKGTPNPAIRSLRAGVARVMADPALRATYQSFGFEPGGSETADFAMRILLDNDEWARYIKQINYRPEI